MKTRKSADRQSAEQRGRQTAGQIGRKTFILLIFLGIFFYPLLSGWWNAHIDAIRTMRCREETALMSEDEKTELFAQAEAYQAAHTYNYIAADAFSETADTDIADTNSANEQEAGAAADTDASDTGSAKEEDTGEADAASGGNDIPAYADVLDTDGNGTMGYLEIPKINVKLIIGHGTSADVLSAGVGHVEGTALPVGGEGKRSVLAAHRGLASRKLFTDLDLLEEGDVFYLYILDEVLAYRVCEIEVVKPQDIASLAAEEGRDLCTLLTCTPYGANTHRLLVTGERISTALAQEVQEEQDAGMALGVQDLLYAVLAPAVLAAIFVPAIKRRVKARRIPDQNTV